MKDKQPVGRPKKAPTCKPALRTDTEKWAALKAKYPGETNRIFNAWVDSLLQK
jgi:hypothetical protein